MKNLQEQNYHAQLEAILDKLEEISTKTAENISDLYADELTEFTDHREELTMSIEPYRTYLTEEDKKRIQDILDLDGVILARMMELKEEAAEFIEKRNAGKSQRIAYQQNYASASMFFDHRK